MSKPVVLVTGAAGEMGHLLLPALKARGYDTVAMDLVALPPHLASSCVETVRASIQDAESVGRLIRRHHPEAVFHLAAILSTNAEREPDLAYDVNVGGTVALFRACQKDALEAGRDVRILFPSSIAVYGLPGRKTKEESGPVKETEWNTPSGIYGCTKLQCELLGTYLTARARTDGVAGIDFRSIRFPGLISADTVPSGGTTDYAPEMIHAAAQGKPYTCFVRPDSRLPFMTMPDAVDAFLALASASAASLTTRVYNVKSFSATAADIRDAVLEHYPQASIRFDPTPARQAIVDTWPADLDDSLARRDWGLAPRHGLREALRELLVPALHRRYAEKASR